MGKLIPLDPQSPEPFVFENKVTGGRIPSEYIPSVEKGFRESLHKGPVAGYEVIGVHMRLEDGSYHDVDSSTMAFEICARDCFRETFRKADPVLLEPIMKVEVEIPTEFQGPVTGAISSKRGVILGTESRSGLHRDHRRSPARRDVRLLERPAKHDAGQGKLQHGIPQVPKAPVALPGRDRQEGDARQGVIRIDERVSSRAGRPSPHATGLPWGPLSTGNPRANQVADSSASAASLSITDLWRPVFPSLRLSVSRVGMAQGATGAPQPNSSRLNGPAERIFRRRSRFRA